MISGADRSKAVYLSQKLAQVFPKKVNLHFSGSSPPDVFVGRFNYPSVNTGILAPPERREDGAMLNSPEEWFARNLRIEDILVLRGSMIYSKFSSQVKSRTSRLTELMQEVSMARRPASIEFFLKKRPRLHVDLDAFVSPVANPAPLVHARLQENVRTHQMVEKFHGDDVKAADAVFECYKREVPVTSLTRVLSAGILGMKHERKLVPSRWSTTAVDSIIANQLLERVKQYAWLEEVRVFANEYLGNHFVFLCLPQEFSFEVVEKGEGSEKFWQDYEGFFGRKSYASSVTGFYYACKLAVAEYLERMKRQAAVIVFREIRKEYWAHLGVGILREACRGAFQKEHQKFDSVQEALLWVQSKFLTPVTFYAEKSFVLSNYREQRKLREFF